MASTSRHPRYYTRYGNPVHERVAKVVAGLEGTETAIMTGSGMGAIATTILALVQAGDHVIAQTRQYMSTAKIMDEMLPNSGWKSPWWSRRTSAPLNGRSAPTPS